MAETCIDWVKGEKFAIYFSNDATEIRHMRELIGLEGVEVRFDETDKDEGGLELKIPKKFYKRPRAPKSGGRTWTEEQKKANTERLAKWRADNKKNKVDDDNEED